MPTYPFLQVDAFTTQPFGGNPCAVFFDCDGMSDATMLAIAREMNLSETAFVLPSTVGDVRARYFTPAEEIPLAGHPTIATTFALVATNRFPLQGTLTRLTLELQVGPIAVDIHARDGTITNIVMTQKPPRFSTIHDPAEVMPIFGLTPDDLLPHTPIQTVSTGTPQLMIAVRNHDALRRIRMNHALYEAYRTRSDFFSPHLFCLGGATPQGQTFARHFGTPPDLMEDPVTGSATGGMGAYLWHHSLIETPSFIAEQGHWMGRPGTVQVEIGGSRDDITSVKIGGTAVAVLEGVLRI
jgi:trans-2,3-dihydro-3-hydroxyanthranilate isomerase